MPNETQAQVPQFKWLAAQLREHIRSGDLKPGDRLPSWSQMQRDYGVHTSTIERAQKELAAEGLLVCRQGSGTFVAHAPQRKTHGVIGLAGQCFSFTSYSPYWAQVLGGVRDAASQAGLGLLIVDSHSHKGWEKADGILVCDWNDRAAFPNRPSGLPLVSLLAHIEGMASVVADDEGGTRAATERLIQLGHRRIAYLHGDDNDTAVTWKRLAGYHRALKSAGIVARTSWTRLLGGDYEIGSEFTLGARQNIGRWLREDWHDLGCTALLCQNDEAALGALQALTEAGIRVPEDVSVVGFDGTEFCDLISPKLSSVQVPLREIGASGVEMLLQQITNDEVSRELRVFPTRLRDGESSIAPRAQ